MFYYSQLNQDESYLFHFTRDTFTSIAIKNISLDQPKEGLKRIFFRFYRIFQKFHRKIAKMERILSNLILRSEEKYYANNSSSEQSINFPSKIRVSMYYKIIPIRRTKKEKKTSIIRISKDKIEFLQTRIIEFFFSLDKKDSSSFHR